MEVICQSRGTPLPRITWVRQDKHKWVVAEDVPGLRQVSDRYSVLKCITPYFADMYIISTICHI